MSDSVFLRGQAIAIVDRFYAIDPLSDAATLTNPDHVVYEVLDPANVTGVYEWGVAVEVTNPMPGVFMLSLDPQLPPGIYRYRVQATGNIEAVGEGTFDVIESGVLEPDRSPVATAGPCSSWINGDDVAAYDPTLGVGSATWELDDAAVAASALMYELSGRQFPGVCQQVVRPCRQTCGCWGPASGFGPFFWTSADVAGYAYAWWGWTNESGDRCGCGNESYVRLAGYPVRDILEVKIGGVVIDPSEYRLDQRRFLLRLADLSTSPPTDRFWPVCQDLSVPDSEPGTYSISYTYGADVPVLGRWAASQLAAELWKAFPANQGECRLPSRVTRIARSGVTMDRILPTADLLRQGATGLQFVDSFIAAVNPTKQRRRSAVWTPDVAAFPRQPGQ